MSMENTNDNANLHNNFNPCLQELLTSQRGIIVTVPKSGAKISVLIEPAATDLCYLRKATYEKYYANKRLGRSTVFPTVHALRTQAVLRGMPIEAFARRTTFDTALSKMAGAELQSLAHMDEATDKLSTTIKVDTDTTTGTKKKKKKKLPKSNVVVDHTTAINELDLEIEVFDPICTGTPKKKDHSTTVIEHDLAQRSITLSSCSCDTKGLVRPIVSPNADSSEELSLPNSRIISVSLPEGGGSDDGDHDPDTPQQILLQVDGLDDEDSDAWSRRSQSGDSEDENDQVEDPVIEKIEEPDEYSQNKSGNSIAFDWIAHDDGDGSRELADIRHWITRSLSHLRTDKEDHDSDGDQIAISKSCGGHAQDDGKAQSLVSNTYSLPWSLVAALKSSNPELQNEDENEDGTTDSKIVLSEPEMGSEIKECDIESLELVPADLPDSSPWSPVPDAKPISLSDLLKLADQDDSKEVVQPNESQFGSNTAISDVQKAGDKNVIAVVMTDEKLQPNFTELDQNSHDRAPLSPSSSTHLRGTLISNGSKVGQTLTNTIPSRLGKTSQENAAQSRSSSPSKNIEKESNDLLANADIFKRPDLMVYSPLTVRVPVSLNNITFTMNCAIVDELFPGQDHSHGFDVIAGRQLFALNPTLWLTYDLVEGWKIVGTDRLPIKEITVDHKFVNPASGLPKPVKRLHVYINAVLLKQSHPRNITNSKIGGCGLPMSDKLSAGYGVFFGNGSVYNDFGSCDIRADVADYHVLALSRAVSVVMTMSDVQYDIITVHTNSRYVSDLFQYLATWFQRDWQTTAKKPIKNKHEWQSVYFSLLGISSTRQENRTLPVAQIIYEQDNSSGHIGYAMEQARRLAVIAAENTYYYNLDNESVGNTTSGKTQVYGDQRDKANDAQSDIPDFSKDDSLELNQQGKGEISLHERELADIKYSPMETPTKITLNTNPVLEAYHEITGDFNFAENDFEMYVKFDINGNALCASSNVVKSAWEI
ncbi:hypothetical protein V1514DRAFT_333828 [Lipomyces japonicus]|uniref:uncharacterized protein n=1 Tax=Lipomyces japonicus TaxID=56871 RepID=UPI0034CE9463